MMLPMDYPGSPDHPSRDKQASDVEGSRRGLTQGQQEQQQHQQQQQEVPADLSAFYDHPLAAAGTESTRALLHEYCNLQSIERSDVRIADKYRSILDNLLK